MYVKFLQITPHRHLPTNPEIRFAAEYNNYCSRIHSGHRVEVVGAKKMGNYYTLWSQGQQVGVVDRHEVHSLTGFPLSSLAVRRTCRDPRPVAHSTHYESPVIRAHVNLAGNPRRQPMQRLLVFTAL